jgi:hypothetical protein
MRMRGVLGLLATSALIVVSGCAGLLGGTGSGPVKTSLGSCSPYPCIIVDISSLPKLPGTMPEASRTIVSNELQRALYAPLDVDTDEPTQDTLMADLHTRLREYESVSDAHIDWSLTRTAAILYSDDTLTSCEVTNVGYLGGAHGFNERTLMTFDTRTGQRLGVADVVPDQSQKTLSRIVEAEFRRARSIRPGQSLQDAGFFILPGQELPLGENFALTNKGLEIQYNPYEVAPYALGATSVSIPREAIAPLVKADLQGVFTEGSRGAINQ